MKQYKYILMAAVIAGLSSCADDRFEDFRTASTDDPNYAYLNDLGDLKSYVDHAKYPTFKLCGETNAAEFNKQELVYALDVANFEELVTGNAFKYSSVVGDDGSMNFGTIKEFVKNASEAGLPIFGHTLVWHSQQNTKYLNNLIADKELPPDPNGGNKYMKITTGGAGANQWDKQINYALATPLEKGANYTMTVKVKGSEGGDFAAWPLWEASPNKNQWGGSNDVQYMATYDIKEEYTTLTWTFNANFPIDKLQFVFGKVGGIISCDDFTLVKEGTTDNLIKNGDFTNGITGWGQTGCSIEAAGAAATVDIPTTFGKLNFDDGKNLVGWGMDKGPTIVNGICEVGNTSAKGNDWSAQVNYEPGTAFAEGETYHLKMNIKGSVAGDFGAGFQNPNGYVGCGNFPTIKVTTDWQTIDVAASVTGPNATRLLMNIGKYVGTLYIDDFEVYYMKKGNSIPLTDKEKNDTLTWAMDNWIQNMMKNCEGKVKSWDVVNEPMSDAAPSELKTATRDGGENPENNFFWQDYLGKDYARVAVKLARQYGGNDLKLFINDYNLEAAYNKNAKCEGLIKMVEYWESDGVTKIDGIGSQMHVTYSMNKETQAKNQEAVTNMLNLLAKTGKLIRISELDMGIADEAGNKILTANVTEAQHKAMAKYYQFIIDQYLKIIPANQQYGVCAWGITDSPKGSGWRAEEPIGLWDGNYHRKHTYAGFASGLSGQNLVPEN